MTMMAMMRSGWLCAVLYGCGGSGGQAMPDGQGQDASGPHGAAVWATANQDAPLRWNGTSWEARGKGFPFASQVPGSPFVGLSDVWVVSEDDAWGVSTIGLDTIVVKWDGDAWAKAGSFEHGLGLYAIWGTGEDDVWAAGSRRNTDGKYLNAVYHWNGADWSPQAVPAVEAASLEIWGSGRNDVYFATTSGIYRYDGTAVSPEGSALECRSVWGASAADVWAACGRLYRRQAQGRWTPVPLAVSGTPDIRSVHGTGPNDAWAVGTAGSGPVALHWDGTAWAPIPLPSGFTATPSGVFGGKDEAWAVDASGTTLHWNGSAWTGVPTGSMTDLAHVRGR